MYLIKKMITSGMSLQDLLLKAKEMNIRVEDIVKKFNREKQKANINDDKLQEAINILEDQNRVEVKTRKIKRSFCEKGDFRKAILSNLYISDIIDENKYLFVFLCKRINRIDEIGINEYNEQFLNSVLQEVKQKIKSSGIEIDDINLLGKFFKREEYVKNNNSNNDEQEKNYNPNVAYKKRRQEEIERREIAEKAMNDTLNEMEANKLIFLEKLKLKKVVKEESVDYKKEESVDDMIESMLKNAKKYKEEHPEIDDNVK